MANPAATKPKLILLDIYETLLDMSDMEKKVNSLLSNKMGYIIWNALFMQYCFVDNCIVQFNDFATIAKATMQMAGNILGKTINDEDVNDMLEIMKQLPLYEGVQEGLSALIDLGMPVAALTNTPESTTRERMQRTGLISYFEVVLSAERVQKYKPSIEVYHWAAKEMGVKPADVLMVTAHGWDVAGAMNSGMQTAFIKQSKQSLYPLAPEPDYTCKGLEDLALQLKLTLDINAYG